MRNKGFTLIELIAVIAILAAISVITVILVGQVISSSESSLSEQQKRNIEQAAEAYYLREVGDDTEYCVDINTLINAGYLEGNSVLDPKTREPMEGYVKITYASNQYTYQFQETSCISD